LSKPDATEVDGNTAFPQTIFKTRGFSQTSYETRED
jgi:hypothetical protein